MRTVLVGDIVTYFEDYFNKTDEILKIARDDVCIYYYTDKYDCSGYWTPESLAKQDLKSTRNRYKDIQAVKISEEEYKKLKADDMKFRYTEIMKEKTDNLNLIDLRFLAMYDCYDRYIRGTVGNEEEIDIVDGIIGCDKNADKYYIKDMDSLFKNCVTAMYNDYGYREDGRPPLNFELFPENIDEDYFNVDEWGMPGGWSKVTSLEKEAYNTMLYAAEDYLENCVYDLSYIKLSFDRDTNIHTPEPFVNLYELHRNLKGSDIYGFLDFEKYGRYNIDKLEEDLMHDFFFNVRHKCLKALQKNQQNKQFMEKYRKLSLNDFKMNGAMTLEIVDNKDFYTLCGVGIKNKMIDKPMTTDDLFNNICDSLKEKGKWPEILDYALGDSWKRVELKTDEFELKENLDYGGSEGIYLDFWIDIYDEENPMFGKWKLGTFKTLENDDKAMHIMASLLADFILEEKEYVREHRADFNWKGTCLYPADENGKTYGFGRYCYTDQELEEQKKAFLEKYPTLIIRNYETREEFIYKSEQENNLGIER